jgi:hypothetical protein
LGTVSWAPCLHVHSYCTQPRCLLPASAHLAEACPTPAHLPSKYRRRRDTRHTLYEARRPPRTVPPTHSTERVGGFFLLRNQLPLLPIFDDDDLPNASGTEEDVMPDHRRAEYPPRDVAANIVASRPVYTFFSRPASSGRSKSNDNIHHEWRREGVPYMRQPSGRQRRYSCTRLLRTPRLPGAYTCKCLCQRGGCVQL